MELSDLAKLINLDAAGADLKDQAINGTLIADLVGAALDGIKPVLTAAVLKSIKEGEKP